MAGVKLPLLRATTQLLLRVLAEKSSLKQASGTGGALSLIAVEPVMNRDRLVVLPLMMLEPFMFRVLSEYTNPLIRLFPFKLISA
ncbi:hypothetical protein D3C77_465570 [compost metagenome]